MLVLRVSPDVLPNTKEPGTIIQTSIDGDAEQHLREALDRAGAPA